MRIYIRFGEIPKDEKSKIHRGDAIIGEEIGVSVWDCAKINNEYRIVLPIKCNESTIEDIIDSTYKAHYYSSQIIFVVSGDIVGSGSDNEPVIKNIKIIEQLPINYFNKKVC